MDQLKAQRLDNHRDCEKDLLRGIEMGLLKAQRKEIQMHQRMESMKDALRMEKRMESMKDKRMKSMKDALWV